MSIHVMQYINLSFCTQMYNNFTFYSTKYHMLHVHNTNYAYNVLPRKASDTVKTISGPKSDIFITAHMT